MLFPPGGTRRELAVFDGDGLERGEAVQGLKALLAAVAGHLHDPAEGKLGPAAGAHSFVDEHLARPWPPRDAELAGFIPGPDGRNEAIDGAVGHGDGFFLVCERDHHLHRPENLFR